MKRVIPVLALAALAVTACGTVSSLTSPQPQPTGPYDAKIVAGPSCATIGPGWLLVPEGATGYVFHVKSATSCVGDSVTAVIPFANDPESGGKPFNLYDQFQFQKTNPDG